MGTEEPGFTIKRGTVLSFVDRTTNRTTEGLYIGTGENGDYVVVPLSDHPHQPSVGAILNGQFLSQNDMVTFTSKILDVIHQPVTLWCLQVPTDMKKYDFRDNRRVQCSVSASLEAIEKGQVLAGIIRDISKSGARFFFHSSDAAESPLTVGEPVTLRCVFPGMPGEQAARGQVTDVRQSEDEWSIGVRFVESVWWVPPYH